MKYAYRNWLERSNIGDRLPRGAFFNRRQTAMDTLNNELRGAHELTLSHLYDALGHYLDITEADPARNFHTTHPDDLAEDKTTYAYLIKKDGAGRPVFDVEDCAQFMAKVWSHSYTSALAFVRLHSPH